jgi:predicted dehydrogenase
MPKIYKSAIVGCGVGGGIHWNAYRKSERFELAAICDPKDEALEKRSEGMPNLRKYHDYREMLEKEQLDFLSVATLPPTHDLIVSAGVEAGVKAVMCEKPIGHTSYAGRRIIETCEKAGVPLMVTHQARYLPHARELRERVRGGEIGAPFLCEMRINGWDLINAGVHMINLVAFILDDPEVAHAMGQMDVSTKVVRDGMQVETVGVTNFEYKTGVRCALETGEVQFPPNRPDMMTLYGSKGRIDFGLWPQNYTVVNGEHPDGLKVNAKPKPGDATGGGDGHVIMAEKLIGQLESGERDYSNPRQGLAALEIVFASYLSSSQGGRIAVPVADGLKIKSESWAGLPAGGGVSA